MDPHIHVLISIIHACSKTLSRFSSVFKKNICLESRNKNYRTSIDGQTRVQLQVCCINHHVCYSVVLIEKCLLRNRYMVFTLVLEGFLFCSNLVIIDPSVLQMLLYGLFGLVKCFQFRDVNGHVFFQELELFVSLVSIP